GPGSERDVARGRRVAPTDDLLDLGPHGLEPDVERREGLGGDALTLVDQPEQDVLGADEVVVEPARLLLRQPPDPPGPVGEAFEHHPPLVGSIDAPTLPGRAGAGTWRSPAGSVPGCARAGRTCARRGWWRSLEVNGV